MILNADRLTKPGQPEPERKHADESGPSAPKVERPSAPNPLKDRLRKIDPDQAKKYRQRSGQ